MEVPAIGDLCLVSPLHETPFKGFYVGMTETTMKFQNVATGLVEVILEEQCAWRYTQYPPLSISSVLRHAADAALQQPTLTIDFGVLAPPFATQLGVADAETADELLKYERDRDALNRLRCQALLTPNEARLVEGRLFAQIKLCVETREGI